MLMRGQPLGDGHFQALAKEDAGHQRHIQEGRVSNTRAAEDYTAAEPEIWPAGVVFHRHELFADRTAESLPELLPWSFR